MNTTNKIEVGIVQHYLTILTLIISVISSVGSIGYTMRRVDELDKRLTSLEDIGSITAQLTVKDTQWIVETLKTVSLRIDTLNAKLDKHMEK